MDKPDALRLADLLDERPRNLMDFLPAKAAAELRRLHSENASLTAALASSCDEQRHELWESGGIAGCERARVAERQRDALLEALKSTGLFLHHCWCDVQMNDYSFEKLNQQMQIVDAAIAAVEGEKT